MDDHPNTRIVPPAKVHGDSGVTSVSADSTVEHDSTVENDTERGTGLPADHLDKEVDETLAGGLKFPEGA
jgi:hypothetical protein